jgi:hypothetical protein
MSRNLRDTSESDPAPTKIDQPDSATTKRTYLAYSRLAVRCLGARVRRVVECRTELAWGIPRGYARGYVHFHLTRTSPLHSLHTGSSMSHFTKVNWTIWDATPPGRFWGRQWWKAGGRLRLTGGIPVPRTTYEGLRIGVWYPNRGTSPTELCYAAVLSSELRADCECLVLYWDCSYTRSLAHSQPSYAPSRWALCRSQFVPLLSTGAASQLGTFRIPIESDAP